MTAISRPLQATPPTLITWTQNAAIFAVCVNLFSTALANLGFAAFLLLFVLVCLSGQRRHLDTRNFPLGLAIALGIYIGWEVVGLTYTDAPMAYALKSIFSDRKILYILPLALVFSDRPPKERFLSAFLLTSAAGLLLSYALKLPPVHSAFVAHLSFNPEIDPAFEFYVFRSHATQGMVFALSIFLSLWFAARQAAPAPRWAFYALAGAFLLNLATLTPGRSGYVAFLVLVVWAFAMWRGYKGVLIGFVAALALGALAFYGSQSVQIRLMQGVTEARSYQSSPDETSLGRRMVMYKTALDMIAENPVLGVGTGGFKQHFSAIAAKNYTGWRAIPFDDPHNQYLFILAENGLIGLLAFLAAIGMMLRYSLKGGSIYGKMAAGCVLAWCATSLFSGHFRTFPEGHLIAFIVGILMVNRPSGGSGEQPG